VSFLFSCSCAREQAAGSEWPLAASLLDHWTSDLTADVVSYSALISCYGQGKQWQLALELVAKEMADVRIWVTEKSLGMAEAVYG